MSYRGEAARTPTAVCMHTETVPPFCYTTLDARAVSCFAADKKRREQVTSPPSANRQMRRVTALYLNSPDVFGAVYAWTLRVRCRWGVDAALYHTSRGSTTTHTHNTRTRARTNERRSPRRQQTAHAPRAHAHTTRVERGRALAGVLCAAEVSWPRDAERRRRSVPTAQSAAVPTSVHQGVCVCLTRDALLPRLR